MLDGNVICLVPGFPIIYDTEKLEPSPACLNTINFIKNGALLTFSNQHNVMDGTDIFQVVGLLASVLNGEETSRDATEQGNRNPSTVIPLYGPDEPIRDHSYLKASAITSKPISQVPLPWHLRNGHRFVFFARQLHP